VSIARIKNMLEAQFDVRVNEGVIRYALVNFLDCSYGPVKHKKKGMDPKRWDILRTYLRDYADALAKERAGTHVVVYTDESYIHQNHAPNDSWFKEGVTRETERTGSKGLNPFPSFLQPFRRRRIQ
jgi:hypothetical protein